MQSLIAELSDELRIQGSAFAAAQKEKARLAEVEADLSRTIQSLRSELTASQQKHSDELLAASTANDNLRAERDSFRKDRDEHAAKYAELEKEAARLRRRAKAYCDTMVEMDTLLSGTILLTPTAPYNCRLLFVLTHALHLELQRPGLNRKKPLMPLSPDIAPRKLLPEAASKRKPISGLGMSTWSAPKLAFLSSKGSPTR
jgi:hypothetical protein